MKQPHEYDARPERAGDGDAAGDWDGALRALRERLEMLGQAERSSPPLPELEAAVMRAWDEHRAPIRSRRVWWLGGAAAAAALVALVHTARSDDAATAAPVPRADTAAAVGGPAPPRDARTPPLTEIVLIGGPQMPGERIQVVRTRIARDVLAGMGVRPVATDGEMVDIDMLIGEDGVARGVRVETLAQ
jgi:hypothetical protein